MWHRSTIIAAKGENNMLPMGFCVFQSYVGAKRALRVLHNFKVGKNQLVVKVIPAFNLQIHAHVF